jgi:branched-chain amino acid transport system permease protein
VELTLMAVTLAIFGDAWRGAGRLPGLLLGGLAVGLAESVVVTTAGPLWRELVVAGLLLAVLLARGPALSPRAR